MKLRNKLIPLMSTAAIAATVAPITLTSCSAGMVNLLDGNGYVPSIERAKWNEYKSNKTDMLNFYAAAINENPEIFAQDFYWSDSRNLLSEIDEENQRISEYTTGQVFSPEYAQSKVSNIKIASLECKDYYDETNLKQTYIANPENTVKHYAISFDYVLKNRVNIDGLAVNQKYSTEMKISVKNFPITINRADFNLDTAYQNNSAFYKGLLPTDWVIESEVTAYEPYKAPRILYNLEANGFEWSLKASAYEEITTTYLRESKQPSIEKYNLNYFVEKADVLFDSNLPMYSSDLFRKITGWYLPSYYLSDIVDENHQIWG